MINIIYTFEGLEIVLEEQFRAQSDTKIQDLLIMYSFPTSA